MTLASGVELPGRVWQEGRPIWMTDLAAAPAGHADPDRAAASRWCRAGRCRCGWATRCWRCWSSTAISCCAKTARPWRRSRRWRASLGQMLARSQERGRAEELYRQQEILLDSVADGICGVDRHGHGQLCQSGGGAPAGRSDGGPDGQAGPRSAARVGAARAAGAARTAPCARHRASCGGGRRRHDLSRRWHLRSPRNTSLRRSSTRAAFPARCSASATSASAMRWTG